MGDKTQLADVLLSVGLLVLAFPLCVYGIRAVIQGSILGAASLTLGILCFGLSCVGPARLKIPSSGKDARG